jgi:hypothetical protein
LNGNFNSGKSASVKIIKGISLAFALFFCAIVAWGSIVHSVVQ